MENRKTKRVHGMDLPSRCFAYVGDEQDTDTWHACIYVLGDARKTAHAVKTSIHRWQETKGIPESERENLWHTLRGAALALGIPAPERKTATPAPTETAEPIPVPVPVPVIEPTPEPKAVRTAAEIEIDREIEAVVALADRRADEMLRALGLE